MSKLSQAAVACRPVRENVFSTRPIAHTKFRLAKMFGHGRSESLSSRLRNGHGKRVRRQRWTWSRRSRRQDACGVVEGQQQKASARGRRLFNLRFHPIREGRVARLEKRFLLIVELLKLRCSIRSSDLRQILLTPQAVRARNSDKLPLTFEPSQNLPPGRM